MKNPYRLEKILKPAAYRVHLEPDLETFRFKGSQSIEFDLLRTASRLVFHAADLSIAGAALHHGSFKGQGLSPTKITFWPKYETVVFEFDRKIQKKKGYRLDVEFSGQLNDQMHGFYRTSYRVGDETRWGAATQFEATDARRAFVCVDEPDAKAVFHASLTVPNHLTALSNMPVQKETIAARVGWKTLEYQPTPVMSTYLLCFVVAELESVETTDDKGVAIRVFTTPGKKEQGLFALDVARHALGYFAEWFDIPYALPKLDMVALPDFASGAMENWGLVTYRETALLVDEKNSSASAKQRVAEVIDHELAHQWFGNLVTMEWWTDLWLNEGFASYMGPKAVHDRFPEWKLWDQYVATEFLTALHDDSLKNSHPIEIPVKNPHEIREIFDHITYNKGSAVNRMLEHFLGETKFREGLRVYLKKYAYGNARTVDLWDCLEKVSKQPVRQIMAGFTKQEGYPLVTICRQATRKGEVLRMTQKRFIFDGSSDRKKLAWKVPVTLWNESEKKMTSFVLSGKEASIPAAGGERRYIKLNPGHTGFYRAQYAPDLLSDLLIACEKQALSPVDALGLLDDAYSLVRPGEISAVEMLEMLKYFTGACDYNVWLTLSGIWGSIENILSTDEAREAFYRLMLGSLKQIGQKMGWDPKQGESHSNVLLRSLVLSRQGHAGDSGVVGEAKSRFSSHLQSGALRPDLRGAVYSIAAEHGGAEVWPELCALYEKTDLQEEKVRLLRAMTRFQIPDVVDAVLHYSLAGQVRPQDTYVILAGFGSNGKARKAAWKFIQRNWIKIRNLYKSGSVGLLGHILEGATAGFSDPASLSEVERFFKKNPVQGTERTRRQTLELIRSNIAWKKRDGRALAAWLKGV